MTATTDVKLEDLTANSSPADFEAVLSDQENVKTLMARQKFGEFIKNYADAKAAAHKDVMAQVKEEVQATLQEWVKDSGGALRRLNLESGEGDKIKARTSGLKVYNSKAVGASLDQSESAPDDLGDFFRSIWHNANQLSDWDEKRAKVSEWKKIQNAYGSTVPADGGFLIPEVLRSEMLQLAIEGSIVRGRAQVIPMSSLAVPIPTVDETSRVSSVFGGMIAYWTEEGAAQTASNAQFGRVRLEAKKLTVYSEAPDELIADAPAFGGFLASNMPRALAFYEDDAFINGSGVGEPVGVLDTTANNGLITTTRNAATGIDFLDVVRVFTRLLPGSYENAVWLVAPDTIPDLLTLVNDEGTNTASPSLWLTGGQAIQTAPMTLLGRPVIISEKVPSNDNTGDLSLIDFTHYLIGDRQMMQASSSPHFKFSSDVTAYKVVERVDGRPWVQSPLTPKNNGSTLSPYVTTGAT